MSLRPLSRRFFHLLVLATPCVLGVPSLAQMPGGDAAAMCVALKHLPLEKTTISQASFVAAGQVVEGVALPAHCLVQAEIGARIGSLGVRYATRYELRMPVPWNGRFQFQGGGGVDGVIRPAYGLLHPGVTPALAQGAAVASTDGGHQGAHSRDASFGLDPQARIDWGYNAVEQVTVQAKAIVERFYGQPARYAYFVGCSSGGRQGMMAAQRYPQHFDGVVTGAPILEQHLAQVGSMVALQAFQAIAPRNAQGEPIMSRAFSPNDLQLIDKAVLAQCDALDGVADGIIEHHGACKVDLKPLQCAGAKTDACLSPQQVEVFQQVMAGPRDSAGRALYPGPPWDVGISSATWRGNWLGTSETATPNSAKYTNESIRNVFMTPPDPGFDYLRFDVDRDPARLMASAAITTTRGVDYTGFKAKGGKTIVYVGNADSLVNPAGVKDWYRRLVEANGGLEATQRFARFFVAPGVDHCRGGRGLDRFDPVSALQAWVERGVAPETLPSTGASFPGRTRMLCAWPKIARYKGQGSVDDAASFACVNP